MKVIKEIQTNNCIVTISEREYGLAINIVNQGFIDLKITDNKAKAIKELFNCGNIVHYNFSIKNIAIYYIDKPIKFIIDNIERTIDILNNKTF